MKKHIVTIAGRPGSGKSTTAVRVAKELGFDHFSSGDLFRSIAKEQGVDVLQANLSAEDNYKIDHTVDGRLQEIGKTKDRLVIDSRTAWHWIPDSFKVFLDLDLDTAAERILKSISERESVNEDIPRDSIEYAKVLQRRLESEIRRYMTLYKINPYDTSNYDLVVNTKTHNLEQVIELVLKSFEEWTKE